MSSELIALDSKHFKQELNTIKGSVEHTQPNIDSFSSGKSHNAQSLKHYEEAVREIAKLLEEYKALCCEDFDNISNMAINFEEYEQKMQGAFAK